MVCPNTMIATLSLLVLSNTDYNPKDHEDRMCDGKADLDFTQITADYLTEIGVASESSLICTPPFIEKHYPNMVARHKAAMI